MTSAEPFTTRFAKWRANELRPNVLAGSMLGALTIYVLELVFVVSFAALIFSGPLTAQLPQALGFILVGNAILCALISLLSSYSGTIGVEQDTSGALLGLVAATIVAALPAIAIQQQFATVVMMIVLTTTMTGLVFLLLGVFKLGGVARFLPYPVMGGFLAGTGWLLVQGGIGVIVGEPFGWNWMDSGALYQWLPGAVLGVAIFVAVRRFQKPLTLPLSLAVATFLFYAVAWLMNISVEQLTAGGWLLGTFPSGNLWHFPLTPETLSNVNWAVLWSQLPNLVPVAVISVVALLLNSSGVELVVKRDVNLNRELVAAGAGNLLAAPFGGLVGYQTVSFTNLNYSITGGRRIAGLVTALLIGATAFLGASFLAYTPKLILGAILVYLGVVLLYEWIVEAWFRFPRIDFAIILSILAVIVLRSFLEGVIVGLVLAVVLFAISYSRIPVARYAVSGTDYSSRSMRNPHTRAILDRHCAEIFVLKLQGFIFFGTADRLYDQVRAETRRSQVPLRYVVLDMALVPGMDSTAMLSIEKLRMLAREKEITLAVAGLQGRAQAQWFKAGLGHEQGFRLFPDLDHAVEWCEDRIIAQYGTEDVVTASLYQELLSIVPQRDTVNKLISNMERIEIEAGKYLMRQGDASDAMYFIESGQLTALVEIEGKSPMRLETVRGKRSVGEIGFYLDMPRTASVIADEPSIVYRLSRTQLSAMEQSDPDVTSALHQIVIYVLAHRVRHLTNVVVVLER